MMKIEILRVTLIYQIHTKLAASRNDNHHYGNPKHIFGNLELFLYIKLVVRDCRKYDVSIILEK